MTKAKRPKGRLDLYGKDGRQLEKLADETKRQIGFFESNSRGGEDRLRVVLWQVTIHRMLQIANRAARRYWKEYEQEKEQPKEAQ